MIKDIQLGKVYTDKDRPPFKVNEASDHEGQMAKAQLERSMEYAKMIYKIVDNVGDGGEVKMPAWVQSKLTKSMDYLQSVYNYLDGKDGLDDKFQKENINERAYVDTNGTFEVKGFGGNNVFIKSKNLEINLSFKGDDLKDALNKGKGKGKVVMAGVKTND